MPLVELDGFAAAVADRDRSRWTGTRLPAVYDGPRRCSRCGGTTVALVVTIDALFYHGGFGESSRITARTCVSCWHSEVMARESVRPGR